MDYREVEPPSALRAIVKVAWTLKVPGDGPSWVRHRATPDGCLELIRRLSGRSRWDGGQPERFVAGISTAPAELELSAGSAFVGVRLWPWVWRLIAGESPACLTDRWAPLDDYAPWLELPAAPEQAIAALDGIEATAAMRRIADASPGARTSAGLACEAGFSPRALQRWFERNVGLTPTTYLRLVRFSEAFASLGETSSGLAHHAADHGFADQAHMAREFRSFAGETASRARDQANGPFLRER